MTEIWAITIASLFCRHLPWLKNWRTWQHRKKKPRQRHPRKGRALTCITFSPNVLLGMIEISPTQQQSSTFDHDLAVVKYSTIKPLENSRLYSRRVGKLCPWIIICHFCWIIRAQICWQRIKVSVQILLLIIPSSCHLTFKRRRLYSTISAMRLTFLNHFLTQTNQTQVQCSLEI